MFTNQTWFLDRLVSGDRMGPKHIAEQLDVAYKTATRDIAFLREQGLVERAGSKKTGHYLLTGRNPPRRGGD